MEWVELGKQVNVRELAERSRRAPTGCAATFFWHAADGLYGHPDDMLRGEDGASTKIPNIWPAHGIAELRRRVLDFCTSFKAAGGRMDYLELDYENPPPFGAYDKPEWLQALRSDPRGRRLLERVAKLPPEVAPASGPSPHGVPAAGEPKHEAPPEIRPPGADSTAERELKFPDLLTMQVKFQCAALDRAIFDPAREVFPNLQCTNFGSVTATPQNFVLTPFGEVLALTTTIGNRCSPACYGKMFPQFSRIMLSDPRLMNQRLDDDRPYGSSLLNVLRLSLNNVRAIRRACNLPVDPWAPTASSPGTFHENPYYEELLYHLALTGCDTLMLFNPREAELPGNREDEDLLPNACVATVNRLFGAEHRGASTINVIPWNSELIATGQEVGDRMLWRITADTPSRNIRVEPTGEILKMGGKIGRWHISDRGKKLRFEIAR